MISIYNAMEVGSNIKTSYDTLGRIYHTPKGNYYSVTTMLSVTKDKSTLDVWRKRVGENEADELTRKASGTGNDYHLLGEKYLLGEPLPEVQWLPKLLFDKTIPYLEDITKVYSVEGTLYSNKLRIAGRTDAIVDWKKQLCIFDFKCLNNDDPQWLKDYYIQLAIYGMCLWDMTDLFPKKGVLMIACKRNLQISKIEIDIRDYINPALERIKQFKKLVDTEFL